MLLVDELFGSGEDGQRHQHHLLAYIILYFTIQAKSQSARLSFSVSFALLLVRLFLFQHSGSHSVAIVFIEAFVATVVGITLGWILLRYAAAATARFRVTRERHRDGQERNFFHSNRWTHHVAQGLLIWASFAYSGGVIQQTGFQVGLLASYLLISFFAFSLYIMDRRDAVCKNAEWSSYREYDDVTGIWFVSITSLIVMEIVLDHSISTKCKYTDSTSLCNALGRSYAYIALFLVVCILYFVYQNWNSGNGSSDDSILFVDDSLEQQQHHQQRKCAAVPVRILPVTQRAGKPIDPSKIAL